MARNLVQDGRRMSWVNNSGSDVASGQVVVVGNQVYVATGAIANGASGELAAEAVYECPKVTAAVIAQGEEVIWDASENAFNAKGTTLAAGDVSKAAVAWEAAGNGATLVKVKLNVGVGTLT